MSSEGGGRGELEVSAEVILTGSELVLTNPTSSVTGRALMGLLTVQSAAGVSGGGGGYSLLCKLYTGNTTCKFES